MKQFFIDLFSLDRPFPGHGMRVSPPGVYDQAVLRHGNIEDRARMGRRVLEHDLRCLEEIGDDRVRLARPNTRFFFSLGAEDMRQAREPAGEVKRLCGRS